MFIKSYSLLTPPWVYLSVSAILLVLGTYIWQFRNNPGIKYQSYVQYCKSLGLICLLFFTTKPLLPEKIFWLKLFSLIFTLVPYFWLLFVLKISNQQKALIVRFQKLFAVIIFVLWGVILTDSWHHQFSQSIWTDATGIRILFNKVYWIIWLNGYLLYGISFFFAWRWIIHSAGVRRMQAIWFTFSGGLSLLGSVLNNIPALVDYTPLLLSFVLSALAISWGCYHWHAHSVFTLAEKALVKNMADGFVIVDVEDYIVSMNPAAQEILTDLPIQIKKPLTELLAAWPALLTMQEEALESPCEIERETPNGKQYYQVFITILHIRGVPKGKVLVFKEITEQKKNQEQLLEQQKALSILQERERIGRELHDGEAQIWNYLSLELKALSEMLKKRNIDTAQTQIHQLLTVIQAQNTDVREAITGLRCTNAHAADTASCDFIQSLQDYIHWYEKQYKITVKQHLPQDSTATLLRHTSSVQILRILQEALINIRKHAKASCAEIQMHRNGDTISIQIADDGCGFDLASRREDAKGFGLQIMQERAIDAGGHLNIQSAPGEGTVITLTFQIA